MRDPTRALPRSWEKSCEDLQDLTKILETLAWNLHVLGNARVGIQDLGSLDVFSQDFLQIRENGYLLQNYVVLTC